MRKAVRLGGLAVMVVGAAMTFAPVSGVAASIHFTTPVYVDLQRAGGEPVVLADAVHGTLIYTSHEGDSHLFRDGVTHSPTGDQQFVTNACNQVYVWTSTDLGRTWQRVSFLEGTGCANLPAENTGFSDPDLTQDASGIVYNTGIDLANDSLFASHDGGKTWPDGTPQCHDGDRPWLAGYTAGHVFLATDTAESNSNLGHQIFLGTAGPGLTTQCQFAPIASDFTTYSNGNLKYEGFGKLYFDQLNGMLYEPYIHYDNGSTQKVIGVGLSEINPTNGHVTRSTPISTTLFAHWPAIAIDRAGNVYLTWDTDERAAQGTSPCGGQASSSSDQSTNPPPLPNTIQLAVFKNGTVTAAPQRSTVAAPSGVRVLWPWITAGNAGAISVVWYQTTSLVDPDCQSTDVHIYEASIFDALSTHPTVSPIDAAGRSIHFGGVCQGGTGCVATGQDRRLGDFFTSAIDASGCVLIASGDTMLTDPSGNQLPTSRPIFMRQDSGLGLLGKPCTAPTAAGPSPSPSPTGGVLATSSQTTNLPFTGGTSPALPLTAMLVLAAGALLLGASFVRRRDSARGR